MEEQEQKQDTPILEKPSRGLTNLKRILFYIAMFLAGVVLVLAAFRYL
jgi:hypothetical protein